MSENFVNRRKARRLAEQNRDNEIHLKIEVITKDLELANAQFLEAVKLFSETKESMLEEVIESLEGNIKEIKDDLKIVSEDFDTLKKVNEDFEARKAKLNLKRTSHQERFLSSMEDLLTNLEDIEEEVDDLNDEIIDLYEEIEEAKGEYIYRKGKRVNKFQSIEDVSEIINKAFSKLKETFTFDFNNEKNSKTKTLVSLLPFLDDEELDEIADMIINDHEDLRGLKLATIFPFLSEEKCDAIFLAKMTSLNQNEISSIVPFVSQKTLSSLVDQYIAGNLTKVNMNVIYPFLDKEDIKRIFFHELNKEN
ncbi:MAG: hypothetical protein ACOX56_06970 [Acholeplasmataceae bacterium]